MLPESLSIFLGKGRRNHGGESDSDDRFLMLDVCQVFDDHLVVDPYADGQLSK
jgi:hypothetical protein